VVDVKTKKNRLLMIFATEAGAEAPTGSRNAATSRELVQPLKVFGAAGAEIGAMRAVTPL
jgi:hypothetical protein